MESHRFEELGIWKRSCRLATDLRIALHKSTFFSLKDQIQRSAISIPSNIAEGSERDSSKDFARFLKYSKGSSAELRTQLMIYKAVAAETDLPNIPDIDEKIQETRDISKMVQGFIKTLKKGS